MFVTPDNVFHAHNWNESQIHALCSVPTNEILSLSYLEQQQILRLQKELNTKREGLPRGTAQAEGSHGNQARTKTVKKWIFQFPLA